MQSTWKKVLPIREQAAALFYSNLFQHDPSLRQLFKGDMEEQGRKLMAMIGAAVVGLSKLDELVPAVQALGARHAGYGVQDAHYATVGGALLDMLRTGLGAAFTKELETAWTNVYGVLVQTMQAAAKTA
ncbi:MAG: globin domain-containing protein [Candidatus Protistobacter heckmanni]|nr:globin domain-containing protein [Candidatus Protistobacter heckmanni]